MEPKKLADTISEVEACFFGAGVQRDAIPLCRVQGCSALLRSRGKAHWQVKGGSPIGSRVKRLTQGKLMPASTFPGYYLTQNFAGLAALPPSPARNIFAGRRKNV
ncbi:hypothetical protein [Enterocloster clostridioformis]|uniref:hypothetical protein n=1 Tax=Anaerotignum sp. TaxID=2039241 RepID=UPI003994521A